MKFQNKAHANHALKVAKQMKKAKSGMITRKAKRIARTADRYLKRGETKS